jgi:hypothetical protein
MIAETIHPDDFAFAGEPLEEFTPNAATASSADVGALRAIAFFSISIAFVFQAVFVLLPDATDLLNTWAPISLAACCLGGIAHLVRTSGLWLWSPLASILAAIAVFHGLGPLLHIFGDPAAIAYANQFAMVEGNDLARTNLLNLWSTAALLATFTVCFPLSRKLQVRFRKSSLGKSARKAIGLVTWGIIGVALPLKYFVVLPYFLGWTDPDFVLPGFVVVLGNLSLLCMFLLLYYAWTYSALLYIPATAILLLEIVTGLICFNKTEVISALGISFLGLYFAKPSKKLAIGAVIFIAGVYLLITPIVSKGRLYLESTHSSLSERFEALQSAWTADSNENPDNVQGWWTRLCYANAQAFCMREHDAGIAGNTFSLILAAAVPRILWADKPIMTPGFEFNQTVTGNRRSSSAPGVFAEAYWNAGWFGVILTAAYLGILLSVFTRVAFRHVAEQDLRWLPFGVGGLLMGASVTDWFASTYVGGALTYVLYLVFIKALMPSGERES